jgi:Zn-dependent oligopeptidase
MFRYVLPTTLAIHLHQADNKNGTPQVPSNTINDFDEYTAPDMKEPGQLKGDTIFTKSKEIKGLNDGQDMIRWDHSVHDLEKLTEQAIALGEKTIKEILAIPAKDKTFENTMMRLARYESDARAIGGIVGFYKSVSPHKSIRDASQKSMDKLDEKSSKLTNNEEFFQCIRDFKVQSLSSGEWANLSHEQ